MRISFLSATAVLTAALLLAGCNHPPEVPADSRPRAKADSKQDGTQAATNRNPTPPAKAGESWGTVKGQVTWGGKSRPAEVKIDTSKEPALHKCKVVNEEFVVGKNGGVKNVFVWLQKGDNFGAKLPIHPSLKAIKVKEVVIDQPCCKFEPRVVALREGQVLIGKNSSSIAHNMKWTGEPGVNDGDNKLISPGSKIEIKLAASRKPIAIECNIHPWMKGWVRVFNHPYFAVTDAEGKFEIKDAPTGKYNLVMWQEGVGWVNGGKTGQTIDIPAGKTVEVNAKLKPEDK